MKYSEFKKIPELNYHLLLLAGCLKAQTRFIEIDNMPNYDITEYSKSDMTSYAMDNPEFDFSETFSTVLCATINSTQIYAWDDIERIQDECGVEWEEDSDNYGTYITRAKELIDDQKWQEFGMEPDIDQFRLTGLDIASIDNTEKKLRFQGGYVGDSFSIQPEGWALVCECSMLGIATDIERQKFYLELISESYALLLEKKYKISFFMAFTALDSYINAIASSSNTKSRLGEKLNELFNKAFGDISRHEIYNGLVSKLGSYEKKRNDIAHGNIPIAITETEANGVLEFVLVIINSLEKKIDTFETMKQRLLKRDIFQQIHGYY